METLQENLPMRGNYYAPSEYLNTDVQTGVARNRLGTRMLALTNDFLIGLVNALQVECGEAADEVLKSCGRRYGGNFAKRFEQEMSAYYGYSLRDFSMALFHACLAQAFAAHGWGDLHLDLQHEDKGILNAEIRNAFMADILQSSERFADPLLAGLLSGFFSHFAGQQLDCAQTECKASGGATSRFVITLPQRLGNVAGQIQQGKSHEEIVKMLAAEAVA